MKKLQFLQVVLVVTWCTLLYNTSEAIRNEGHLIQFVRYRVIPPFQKWAQQFPSTQFAVMMLMDTNSQWKEFEFSPPLNIPGVNKERAFPDNEQMVNYFAALPKKNEHAESRLMKAYDDLLKGYKEKKGGADPKAIVLYTWYEPCTNYNPKHTNCSSLLREFFYHIGKLVLQGTEVIVAYTEDYYKLQARAEVIEFIRVPVYSH